MIQAKFLLIMFIVFVSCSGISDSKNDKPIEINTETKQEPKVNNSKYKFSITKNGYTEHIIDKFHHIEVISDIDITSHNLHEVKEQLLLNPIVSKMIDSLLAEVDKIGLPNEDIDSVTIDFYDSHFNKCQTHGSDCIFRYYKFARIINGIKHHYTCTNKNEIRINNLPITGYSIDSLLKYFGEPDSTSVHSRYDFGEGMYKSYFYGGTRFSVDEGDSLYYMEYIDYTTSNFKVLINDYIISKNTTLEDLKTAFPLSYLNIENDSYKTGQYDKRIRILNMTNGEFEDTAILIEFKNDKISKLKYFINWV